MHCFTGDIEAARAYLDAGYYLGIGGVATFKKSAAVRAAVAYAPMDRLLLETDCPYLAPQFKRGRRNEPSLPARRRRNGRRRQRADRGGNRRRNDGDGAGIIRHGLISRPPIMGESEWSGSHH